MDSLLVWKGLRKKPGMRHPGCADALHGWAINAHVQHTGSGKAFHDNAVHPRRKAIIPARPAIPPGRLIQATNA
ncbi:hypothetical protein [Lautropia mirabilis]